MSGWAITQIALLCVVSFAAGVWLGRSRGRKNATRIDREELYFRVLVGLTLAVALAIAGVVIWFLAIDWPENVNEAAALGQRGDFFGGFINPFLTFVAFIGFLYTVRLQHQEIKRGREQDSSAKIAADEQNKSIREQNYQAAFFQMLGSYNDIVSSIRVEDPARENALVSGRAAFRTIYSALRRVYREKKRQYQNVSDVRVLTYSYETIYRKYQYELGHYFRSLYNTILMLEDGPDSEKHIKLLRAQISNQELLVLFYNCAISPHGARFRDIAERHEIFNNIPPHLLSTSHAELLPEKVFGVGGYSAILSARAQVLGDMRDAPKRS